MTDATRLRVERGTLTKSDGSAIEVIAVRNDLFVPLAFEFDELDEAEHVAHEILRLAAEWRAERR